MGANGILNIHKPTGMTSHDVVARVRRILKTKRCGHAGTLDPDATGVLVVAVGVATRILPILPLEPKIYVAECAFGISTTTEDASGIVTEVADSSALSRESVVSACESLTGDIEQIPPMVSAVHHNGERLYEIARRGETVERMPRRVHINAIHVQRFVSGDPAMVKLIVVCGTGVYIRTLCVQIGAICGLPAHMASLIREQVGAYTLNTAVTLDELEELGANAVISLQNALPYPQYALSPDEYTRVKVGNMIAYPQNLSESPHILLLYLGNVAAIASPDGTSLRPHTVFAGDGYPAP